MARTVNRSACTGRLVEALTARRGPSTTVTERVGRGTSNKSSVNRSAATGRFVKESTVQRHPSKTIKQRV